MTDQPRVGTESIQGRRPYQEDAVLSESLPDGRTLVAVADGMGGHAAGEVASGLALESLVEGLSTGKSLEESFELANERVHEKAREPGKQGMGTTLVAMLLDADTYHVANVGDSRGYLISADSIRQVTDDHSFVAEAMKRGQSEEEASSSKWKDALTRGIGIAEEVQVDIFGPFTVEDGTALLLCSDGLYKVMDAPEIRSRFLQSSGPRGGAQSLAAGAYEDGSDDNISVAVAEFGEVPRDRPAGTMPLEFEVPDDDPEDAAGDEEAAGEAEAPAADPAPAAPESSGFPLWLIGVVVVVVVAVAAFLVLGG